MKNNHWHTLWRWPFFLLLLPVFYFLHQVNENYAPGLGPPALGLMLCYTGAGLLICGFFYLFLKDFRSASLLAALVIAFDFFFGYGLDKLKDNFGEFFFLAKYSVLLPLFGILVLVLFSWIKIKKPPLLKTSRFLSLLFVVLSLYETVILFANINRIRKNRIPPPGFVHCAGCPKPDVYLIIADGYAGRDELETMLSFKNDSFETALRDRGFHIVPHTRSNYNATAYSMAALFSLNYVPAGKKRLVTQGDLLLCRHILNKNHLAGFFENNGYEINNLSFFELQGRKKQVNNFYFHPRSRILSFSTLINRFQLDAGFHFFSRKKTEMLIMNDFNNDETIDSLARLLPATKTGHPKFSYIHFTRPHHPYYFDRNGAPMKNPENLRGFAKTRKQYTEYLQYTNQRLLQLLDTIISKSASPPLILLASDHGFRQFTDETAQEYYFMNFSAVLLPSRHYNQFYSGMSPVNTFRVILNTEFGQHLPLLKDSSSFLIEKAGW